MMTSELAVRDDEWVGTRRLFENGIVRVWDFDLPPGGATKMHTHRRDWLYVNVTGNNKLRVDYPEAGESTFTDPEDGDASFRSINDVAAKKRTHQANNVGTERLRQVLIEFKTNGRSASS